MQFAAAQSLVTVTPTLEALLCPLRVPPVTALAALGVSRVSVGGSFAFAASSALVDAARELRERGTYTFTEQAALGVRAAQDAFTSSV